MPLTDELEELAGRVRNWGRWGDVDERGTQNFIDSEATRRGIDAAVGGRPISLAIPLGRNSPQEGGAPGRFNPIHTMLTVNTPYTGSIDDACFNDDMVVMPLSAATHIDALAHVSYSGKLYNGFPASAVSSPGGAGHCGADTIDPIVTRGVLLDLPAVKGIDRLDPGYAVTAEDLDAAVDHAQVTLAPGDALVVRTGHMQHFHEGDTWAYNHDTPGLSSQTIEWVHRNEPGVVFTDTYAFEVWPPENWATLMVVHMIHLRDMGQLQGQNLDLESLAVACDEAGRHEFLFTAAPDPFTGGCSAPVAPVAVL